MSVGLNGIDLLPQTGNLVLASSNTQWSSVSMSGDTKITGGGVTAIQPGVVSNAKLNSMQRGTLKYGNSSNAASDLTLGAAGAVLLSDGTDAKWTPISGGATLSATGVLTLTQTVSPKTVNYTVTTADTSTLFTNTGATGAVDFKLPIVGIVGSSYQFAVVAAQTVTITSQTASGILTNNGLTTQHQGWRHLPSER